MTTPTECCPECGALMKEYKHGLGKCLMRGMKKLVDAGGGPLNIADELSLTKSEYTNFSKLAYWGLVEKANKNGGERGGTWAVTPKGWRFVSGELAVHRQVWSYRGAVVGWEPEMIRVTDVAPDRWKYRPQYAREGVPHDPDRGRQGRLI